MGCAIWYRELAWSSCLTLVSTLLPVQVTASQNAAQPSAQSLPSTDILANNGPVVTLHLPQDVSLVMLKMPAGSFQMGSPENERDRSASEGPAHKVTFKYPFYLGKYEVTQQQWKVVMGVNPAHIQASNGYSEDLNKPVECVSWNEITGKNGFIERLNHHLRSSGQGSVRLPSEAEWEYACRAGAKTRFYFGESLAGDDDATNAPTGSPQYPGIRADYMLFSNNSGISTHPVGQKRPNAWGLFDMAGNVQEWCQDWFHETYNGAPADGSAWENPSTELKVVRGGAWDNVASICRSANRASYYPDDKSDDVGFRLVWVP